MTQTSFPRTRSSPIISVHEDLGANFFVWNQMLVPKSYGKDIESEHWAIRQAAGLTDMSGIKKIWIKGAEASEVINYLITRDCNKIKPGSAAYAALLDDDGHLVDDAVVFNLSHRECQKFDADWLICLGAGFGVEYLTKSLRGAEVIAKADDDVACLMLQGPNSKRLMNTCATGAPPTSLPRFGHGLFSILGCEVMIARTSYSGEDGFEIFTERQDATYIWRHLISNGASPVGFDAIDIARVEAGLLFFGKDMTGLETLTELELDFIADESKREFRGKTAWQRKSKNPRHKLCGLSIDGLFPMREGASLWVNNSLVGEITSYAASAWLGRTVAIARIKPGLATSKRQVKVFDEDPCYAEGRAGTICSRRFYSNV